MAKVLLYNMDSQDWAPRLRMLLFKLGMGRREVLPEEFGQKIGFLGGLAGFTAEKTAPDRTFTEPMMVMCGFASGQLNALLEGMKADGLPRIALKAMLTNTNAGWTGLQLHDELMLEEKNMQKYRNKPSKQKPVHNKK